MSGEIVIAGLYISPDERAPMIELSEVEAIAGVGLRNDRYALDIRRGEFQIRGKARTRVRQVTFFPMDALKGTGFNGIDTRRNVGVSGLFDAYKFLGRRFRFGDAIFEGDWECKPCKVPSIVSGKPGFEKLLPEIGGIRARILEGGILQIGQPLVLIPTK